MESWPPAVTASYLQDRRPRPPGPRQTGQKRAHRAIGATASPVSTPPITPKPSDPPSRGHDGAPGRNAEPPNRLAPAPSRSPATPTKSAPNKQTPGQTGDHSSD